MKYILLLLLVSCSQSPKFKAGDCITQKNRAVNERWLTTIDYKIIEVGNKAYRVHVVLNDSTEGVIDFTHSFEWFDDDHIKVPCKLDKKE